METNQRIFGLDLMRIGAIGMILLAQCIWISRQLNEMISQLASLFHFIGLEIFFVLSGFLLGNATYTSLLKEDFEIRSVGSYIKRRALQILPLYFLILLINFGIAAFLKYPVEESWKYFLLLQNFASPMPAFFSESWGLPIIVFSAVLFPFVLQLLNRLLRPKNKSMLFLITTMVLLFVFLISKIGYNFNTANTTIGQWDASLKSVLIYRCDAVFIGVLFSWLLNNYHSVLNKIKWPLTFLGCVGIAFIFAGVGYFHLLIENHKLLWNVFYLPLVSLSIAFFLPLLTGFDMGLVSVKKAVTFISKMTYAMYLVYFGIAFLLVFNYFADTHSSIVSVTLYLILVFVLGFLLQVVYQKAIEKLMIRKRNLN